MLGLYVVTMFVSATLLFLVQPMFARMVLPLLGGSPAVWNTTVVFYQAVLLAGYVYAHASTAWLGVRRQAALHVGLLALPLLVLPIAVPGGSIPPTDANPIPWLLSLLAVAVGLPFFVVSASSPMLQRWFIGTNHPAAGDPYFLYAASNVGSMLALLSYPVLVEPNVRLADQSLLWTGGYALLALLTACCALTVWRSSTASRPALLARATASHPCAERLSLPRRARWVLLAFAPSSLMLSVTTYVSNNIVPIPLLWVVPLALYLLTFILVFAGRPVISHALIVRALPASALLLSMVTIAQASQPIWLLIALHLSTFFVVSMACHGEMARGRPGPSHLTEFYLWMSLGGVLGGMFNALLAPTIFTSIAEYPIVLVAACLLMPPATPARGPIQRLLDVALPAGLGLMTAGLVLTTGSLGVGPVRTFLVFGIPALFCYSFSRRPARFGFGIAALFAASTLYTSDLGTVLHVERSFYGIHRVIQDPERQFHMLAHGGTLHGMQSLDPARRDTPLTYFYPTGPIGQVFEAYGSQPSTQRIAVVGLGAGSLVCYRQPGQRWTLYELDPTVVRIARDEGFFSFLRDCTPDASMILGDARLSLAQTTEQYDLLVLDAYSSDAPPLHLLTREAVALYLQRLAPHGLLAFNVSNDFLSLQPVLAALASDAGLAAYSQDDVVVDGEEAALGKRGSQWVVMARTTDDLRSVTRDPRWQKLAASDGLPVWTDDFSSILTVLKRR
ncbi:MAG: fused MFS/spermidine synthase [Chloroflexi bacterium]|nr:fused MFS/spermidine synthase [Chloroflexota bacterium]